MAAPAMSRADASSAALKTTVPCAIYGNTETWDSVAGGDGGWCASDPTNPNFFSASFNGYNCIAASTVAVRHRQFIRASLTPFLMGPLTSSRHSSSIRTTQTHCWQAEPISGAAPMPRGLSVRLDQYQNAQLVRTSAPSQWRMATPISSGWATTTATSSLRRTARPPLPPGLR